MIPGLHNEEELGVLWVRTWSPGKSGWETERGEKKGRKNNGKCSCRLVLLQIKVHVYPPPPNLTQMPSCS